jgi:hypothetical protein
LSNNSDARIHWRVWVMYFYSWGNPMNLRHRQDTNPQKVRDNCALLFSNAI